MEQIENYPEVQENFEQRDFKVAAFFGGRELKINPAADAEILERARRKILSLYHRVEKKERNGYLFFDIDGVLISAGLETKANEMTLDQYLEKHADTLQAFKIKIESLHNLGFKVAINTGRGAEFSRRIRQEFFPGNCVAKIICEGGAEILSYGDGSAGEERLIPKSVKQDSLNVLNEFKEKIILHITKKLNGHMEKGKETILSFNAPLGQNIEEFFEAIKKYLKSLDILDKIDITHSKTAVDITPLGADKLKALVEVLEDDMSIYFGDARSDEDAMMRSVVNVVPANGMESTKKRARQATFGLVAERDEINGIADALRVIELAFRLAKGKYRIAKVK